jgi:pSer/pThr/pTyr-binding forkhead associated (FHA) protein
MQKISACSARKIETQMATITLAKSGAILQTVSLSKERTTLGRRTYNDIVIDAPGISAEHAVIVTSHQESCFEDIGSTNGSLINGQPSRIHFLEDGDVIELAGYTLTYRADMDANADALAGSAAAKPSDKAAAARLHARKPGKHHAAHLKPATIKITSGPHAGREVALTKVLTTIGQPGIQVAAFTINAEGCSLTHVEGPAYPSVNGVSIGRDSRLLAHNDIIAICGAEAVFCVEDE